MGKYKDLTGQKFHHLTVISDAGWSASRQHMSNCKCDCGNKLVVANGALKNGHITSCGHCEFSIRQAYGLSTSQEYQVWYNIKERCYNPNFIGYQYWGGRGITMFVDWIDNFKAFYDHLLTLPETLAQFKARTGKRATLDRIDTNNNYEPGNIQWITYYEQERNRTNNTLSEQLVKFIKWEYQVHKLTRIKIFNLLKSNYNYQGSQSSINQVIQGGSWPNININKELVEYQQFGTINNVVIVDGVVTPDNFT